MNVFQNERAARGLLANEAAKVGPASWPDGRRGQQPGGTRRSFFKKLAAAAAVVALAPQLCFRQRLEIPTLAPKLMPYQLVILELLDELYTLSKSRKRRLHLYR